MVKISHSFVLIAAVHAAEDGDAMLQVGKHAPALVQTASTVRASRHQQALQMESNFEKLAAEAVRTGETPSLGADARSAVDSALDTLETELENEKIANDAEMDGAIAQFAVCNTVREHSFLHDVDGMKSMVEQARNKHAECRGTEDPNCGDEKTTCDDQDDYAKEAHDAGPHCVCEAFDTAGTQKVCLERAVKWGAAYNTALGNKITACDGAEKVAREVAEVCDRDQVAFQAAVCSYKVLLTATCELHSACYEDAVSNRDTMMKNVKLKEASEKIMWKSCKKVRCYLNMLDATQVSQEGFNKCKQQDDDTKHLDVIYPDAPEMEVCDTDPVSTVPGDPAWLKVEYEKLAPTRTWKPKRNGIEDVTPCPQLTSLVLPTQPTEKARLGVNGGGIFVPTQPTEKARLGENGGGIFVPTQPTEKARLGENGGGIFEPQPMIVKPEASVTEDKNKYFQVPDKMGAKYGGLCTCPDGRQYDVSDSGDTCRSLQCHGGIAGRCDKVIKESRAGFKVECA